MRLFNYNFFILSSFSIFSLQASLSPKSENSFPLGGDLSLAFDSFRSLPDGTWGGNMGAYVGVNLAWAVPKSNGNGIQGGASYGIYDWDGRGSTDSKSLQQQEFFTFGFFHKTKASSGVNWGTVYDWSVNRKAGVFGVNPTMGQVRAQVGYLVRSKNEFGIWGTYGTLTVHESYIEIPVPFRAISQVNAFWRHTFSNRGETFLWAGTPYRKGLMYGSGRAGNYIVGASFRAPLCSCLSLEGRGMYMGARGGSAFSSSKNYAADVSLGIVYSFGGTGEGARPYLPLANNGNFIADTGVSY